MAEALVLSEKMESLVCDAVEFASGQRKESHQSFLPFILAVDGEKKDMTVLEELPGTKIQSSGLEAILERNPERAVLCYDGFLTVNGERMDAIYAIGCERGYAKANVFARPYRPKSFLRSMWFGELARYDVVDNPLADHSPPAR